MTVSLLHYLLCRLGRVYVQSVCATCIGIVSIDDQHNQLYISTDTLMMNTYIKCMHHVHEHMLYKCILYAMDSGQTQVDGPPGEVWGKPRGGSGAGRKGNIGIGIVDSATGAVQAAIRGSLLEPSPTSPASISCSCQGMVTGLVCNASSPTQATNAYAARSFG